MSLQEKVESGDWVEQALAWSPEEAANLLLRTDGPSPKGGRLVSRVAGTGGGSFAVPSRDGGRIWTLRLLRGWSQNELYIAADVSPGNIRDCVRAEVCTCDDGECPYCSYGDGYCLTHEADHFLY